jgi:CopG antitoxin of type II toxin-antitoxin system
MCSIALLKSHLSIGKGTDSATVARRMTDYKKKVKNKTQTNKPKSRIPKFKSYEEEAQWWDTHNIADYQDEFEPVELEVAKPLIHILRVEMPLAGKIIGKLSRHAQQQGIDINSLVRRWVLEHVAKLENQQEAHAEERDR